MPSLYDPKSHPISPLSPFPLPLFLFSLPERLTNLLGYQVLPIENLLLGLFGECRPYPPQPLFLQRRIPELFQPSYHEHARHIYKGKLRQPHSTTPPTCQHNPDTNPIA